MTAYKNFVQDFPNRCMDILKMARSKAVTNNREVTLSLMVASAGFVVPFERLRPPGKLDHPSRDREIFSEHSDRLSDLMDSFFIGSSLHPKSFTEWHSGSLKSIEGALDSWPELAGKKVMPKSKKVGNVLKGMRNALAHGNIYTKGSPIDSIIFVSVNTNDEGTEIKDYSFVSVAPNLFLDFLERWFSFIGQERLSQFEVSKLLANAA